jgi:hypothetical protein
MAGHRCRKRWSRGRGQSRQGAIHERAIGAKRFVKSLPVAREELNPAVDLENERAIAANFSSYDQGGPSGSFVTILASIGSIRL